MEAGGHPTFLFSHLLASPKSWSGALGGPYSFSRLVDRPCIIMLRLE